MGTGGQWEDKSAHNSIVKVIFYCESNSDHDRILVPFLDCQHIAMITLAGNIVLCNEILNQMLDNLIPKPVLRLWE